MGQLSVLNAANALLSNLTAQLVEQGVKIPDRTGLAPGNFVAWDDEQLVVSWGALSRGQPQATASPQTTPLPPFETILFYEFHITFLRNITGFLTGRGPQGGIPSIDKLDADFETVGDLGIAVMEALMAIHRQGLMVSTRIPFAYGPAEPIGPEGKLAGVICPVTFQAGMSVTGDY